MKSSSQQSIQPCTEHLLLEPCTSQHPTDKSRSIWTVWLDKLGHFFAMLFTESNDIRIRQHRDRNGQLYWYVYDSRTQRSGTFYSESDLRAWIERGFLTTQTHHIDQSFLNVPRRH
jgi:hypothetical protein